MPNVDAAAPTKQAPLRPGPEAAAAPGSESDPGRAPDDRDRRSLLDLCAASRDLSEVVIAASHLAAVSAALRRTPELIDSELLLLALLEGSPESDELEQLLGYFGLPRSALRAAIERMAGPLPALPPAGDDAWTLPLVDRQDAPSPELPLDGNARTLLERAAVVARDWCHRQEGVPLARDLLAAYLETPDSAGHDLLRRLLSLHLADLSELAAKYRHFLADDPEGVRPIRPWLESFLRGGAGAKSDLPVERPKDDKLGFERYVHALALLAASTPPPMAVGVYGPWGSGKSSILKLVQARLHQGYQMEGSRRSAQRGRRRASSIPTTHKLRATVMGLLGGGAAFGLLHLGLGLGAGVGLLLALAVVMLADLILLPIWSLRLYVPWVLAATFAAALFVGAAGVSSTWSVPFALLLAGTGVTAWLGLRWLIYRLDDPLSAPEPKRHLITTWFNAWEHKDGTTLWASLVEQIYEEMEKRVKLRPLHYWRFFFSYRAGRFLKSRLLGLPGLALSLVPVLAGLAAWQLLQEDPIVFGVSTAGVLTALGIGAGLNKPVTQALKDSLRNETRTMSGSLMEEVGANLDFLYRSLTGRDLSRERLDEAGLKPGKSDVRIVVFIDDLDRCPPDRVVEVLEAIKLILEKPFIVVFVAMDVRMLVRAIEQRYQGSLPETIHPGGPGMEYLEKIIQIPFWVPQAYMASYAETLFAPPARETLADGSGAGEARRGWRDRLPFRSGNGASGDPAPSQAEPARQVAPEPAETLVAEARDYLANLKFFDPPAIPTSDEELGLIGDYAGYFATSPRGVKRVVNLFRLAKGLEAWMSFDGLGPPEVKSKIIRLIVLGERFPDFWEFVYEHVTAASQTPETVGSLCNRFVARELQALSGLAPRLESARRAELALLRRILEDGPTLSLEDMRDLSTCVVNLPPVRSWDSLASVHDRALGDQSPSSS